MTKQVSNLLAVKKQNDATDELISCQRPPDLLPLLAKLNQLWASFVKMNRGTFEKVDAHRVDQLMVHQSHLGCATKCSFESRSGIKMRTMSAQVDLWIKTLSRPDASVDAHAARWIATATVAEITLLLEKTTGLAPIFQQTVNTDALRSTLESLPRWATRFAPDTREDPLELAEPISACYIALTSVEKIPRQHLLSVLATLGGKKNLNFFCELILKHPPKGTAEATIPFLPLFRDTATNVSEYLFPSLLPGLANPDLAPVILDLANFLTRTKRIAGHPAADRVGDLVTLLDGLIIGLEDLQTHVEEQRQPDGETFRRYNDSMALVVSLCDALALIGDASAVDVLNRLLQLRHRRLRVEAAAALACLGQAAGQQALVELAAEPGARLRVLSYAAELDLLDAIDERFREPVAVAEAELVAFLSQPTAMGVPPSSCELVDSHTQYWPGYEEPRICYLFRYSYEGVDAQQQPTSYSNIGIAGPLVHAFRTDLGNLPVADIYSAFAGWQTEHAEIYETECKFLDATDRRELDELVRRVEENGYQEVVPLRLGSFFGDRILIADAIKPCDGSDCGQAGSLIVDPRDVYWYPHQSERSIDGEMAYNIYKGKRLLQAFND